MTLINKTKKSLGVVRYYFSSDKENYETAESYIDAIIKGNNDIVAKNINLINYTNQNENSEIYSYLMSGKVQSAVTKRDRTFDAALRFYEAGIGIEDKNIESAKKELIKFAKVKFDRLGLIEPEVIDVDKLIKEGFFFKEDPATLFNSLKRETLLVNYEPSNLFGSFYRYQTAINNKVKLEGFREIARQAYQYVEYREEMITHMGSFTELPVYRKTLSELAGVNNGKIFAIDKSRIDAMFTKHDYLWKNDRRIYGNAIIFSEGDKPYALEAKEQGLSHKVFEYEVGYLRTRPTISSLDNADADGRKVLFTADELTRFVESAFAIKGLRGDTVRFVDYIAAEFGAVPQSFEDSKVISDILPKDVPTFVTDDNPDML